MIGAIVGDVIGSVYENLRTKDKQFKLFRRLSTFTDDTVLSVAVADAILHDLSYGQAIKSYARKYPLRGYGPRFLIWMATPGAKPYNSFGNGSAMRVSPVAHAYDSVEKVLEQAGKSAECTHNHPEGIKGAQATALAVYLARIGSDKDSIRSEVESRFDYDLSRTIEEIRPDYGMDLTCQGSVPQAITAFLDSDDFEDAIRNAVSLGGDADTQACIAGAIAEAYYKHIPIQILNEVRQRVTDPLWAIAATFTKKHGLMEIADQIDAIKESSS